ncbi:hypothetical protein KY347_01180 [Candidatus Woesearchaeota archaeon]|nr:hypothetical protein [Candidatus Woesearchaeota archaeon]
MINLYLVWMVNLTEEKFLKIANRKVKQPAILLFPEYTLHRKFTHEELKDLVSSRLNLAKNTHIFFSAFELEQETLEEKMGQYKANHLTTSDNEDPALELLLAPRYINKGFLISGSNNGNIINEYSKCTLSRYDSINQPYENGPDIHLNDVGLNYSRGPIVNTTDYSKIKIKFPLVSLEGKDIEFRVCSDIECGTQNNPDIVLVSSFGLENVRKRLSPDLHEKLLVVNIPKRYDSFVYIGEKEGRVMYTASMLCKTRGIKLRNMGHF